MGKLESRKSRLVFETSDTVWDCGRSRRVIIEAHPRWATVRLQGRRKAFVTSYAAVYSMAVKQSVREALEAKKAAKKKAGGR